MIIATTADTEVLPEMKIQVHLVIVTKKGLPNHRLIILLLGNAVRVPIETEHHHEEGIVMRENRIRRHDLLITDGAHHLLESQSEQQSATL